MRSKLSNEPRNKYSPTEEVLFDIIASSKKPINLFDIAADFYEVHGNGQLPLNWQPIIRVTLNQLMKKMELNKEAWCIDKIKTPGEKELTYKLKRRK